jgi:hypothetical protein
MVSGFGMFSGAIGFMMCIWFIHMGFLIKKSLKEQQETNRLLREMGTAGSGLETASKAA